MSLFRTEGFSGQRDFPDRQTFFLNLNLYTYGPSNIFVSQTLSKWDTHRQTRQICNRYMYICIYMLTFQNWVDWVAVLPGRGKGEEDILSYWYGDFQKKCRRKLWRIWNIGLLCYLDAESWHGHLKVLIWGFSNGVFF